MRKSRRRFPPAVYAAIIERQNGKCACGCGEPLGTDPTKFEWDHWVEIWEGGEDVAEIGMDKHVEAVRARLAQRAERGLRKYGTTTERVDLSHGDWLQHLQDELLDAAVYIERLKAP